jgi:hypothetical protein
MIIVAGGDSFVYGSELNDCRDNVMDSAYGHSMNTFPALLANGNEYYCTAWPGYGNDSIARNVIKTCETVTADFVIVSWTFPGRYEFRFDYDTKQRTGNWYTITPWTIETLDNIQKEYNNTSHDSGIHFDHVKNSERAKSTGIADFAKTFYSHVGSEYWEIYSSLKEVVYLQNYLKANGIRYLFTCADNSLMYNSTVVSGDDNIWSLFNQVDFTHWFWFPEGTNPQDTQTPRGFYQWAIENKYPVGVTHPLEQAHQEAAKLMQGKFNELVQKSV